MWPDSRGRSGIWPDSRSYVDSVWHDSRGESGIWPDNRRYVGSVWPDSRRYAGDEGPVSRRQSVRWPVVEVERPVAKHRKGRQGRKREELAQGKKRQRTCEYFVKELRRRWQPGVVRLPSFKDVRLVPVEKTDWRC